MTTSTIHTTSVTNNGTNTITPQVQALLGIATTWLQKSIKTTPGQLSLVLAVCSSGILLLGIVAWWTWSGVNQTVKTVGKDTVPSIVTAERIRATLADANTNAMNALLVNESSDGKYTTIFRKEMDDVHADLMKVISNVTYGDEERKPILTIMTELARYERIVGRATGKSRADAIADYVEANKVMREKILPACGVLDQVNYGHLDDIYNSHRTYAYVMGSLFTLLALLLLVVLAWTQWFLFQKSKRRVNPGFLLASAVVIVFMGYWVFTFFRAESNLRLAKQDAFTSLHALWQARAIAYDAGTDESLYMLYHDFPAQQTTSTAEFQRNMDRLAVGSDEELQNQLANNTKINGFWGDEIANITFAGEEAAAIKVLQGWMLFRRVDAQIRQLEQSGQYEAALTLNLGEEEGQSFWAFEQFDQPLDTLIEINTTEFNRAIDNTLAQLAWFPYLFGGMLLVSITACVAGMRPRLEEYR